MRSAILYPPSAASAKSLQPGMARLDYVIDASAAPFSRRRFIRNAGLASAFFSVPGAFAEELMRTPEVTEGPLYPDHLPLDKDNDLIVVGDSTTPAVGEVTHVSGRILDSTGQPIKDAVVEIWQVDHHSIYLQERDERKDFDPNFQGWGRFETGTKGEYRFRTIKPVAYPSRQAPHIHFMVKRKGHEPWATQLYIKGHPGNARDGIYRRIGSGKAQEAVTVDFVPMAGSKIGELAAKFDIVMGDTPEG
jgi:protocatechuate 3,4-dioxygenase beta subunit